MTFAPLQTEAHVSIPVIGDTRLEPPELLLVAFRDPINAEIAGLFGAHRIGFGLGIILDDPSG